MSLPRSVLSPLLIFHMAVISCGDDAGPPAQRIGHRRVNGDLRVRRRACIDNNNRFISIDTGVKERIVLTSLPGNGNPGDAQ